MDFKSFLKVLKKIEHLGTEQEQLTPSNIPIRTVNYTAVSTFVVTLIFASINYQQNPAYLLVADGIFLCCTIIVLFLNRRQKYAEAKLLLVSSCLALLTLVHLTYADAEYHLLCAAVGCLILYNKASHQIAFIGAIFLIIFLPNYVDLGNGLHIEDLGVRPWTNLAISLLFMGLLVKYVRFLQNRYAVSIAKQKEYLTALNEERERSYAMIAHDFKAPLISSHQVINLILANDTSNKDSKPILKDISNQLWHLSNNAETLINWTTLTKNGVDIESEHIPLKDAISHALCTLSVLSTQKEITVEVEVNDLITVFCNKWHLEIILKSLISNAIKFSHREGSIWIKARQSEAETKLCIQDYGIGMPQSRIDNLLKRQVPPNYGTAGERGTGLGLMLSNQLAQINGIDLSIESTEGKGSRFCLGFAAEQRTDANRKG